MFKTSNYKVICNIVKIKFKGRKREGAGARHENSIPAILRINLQL